MLRFQVFLLGVVLFLPARPHAEESRPVYLGLDGEFGVEQSTSAQAIERGILTAIDEINRAGGVLKGRPLQLVSKDNRSVTARGVKNLQEFARMPDMVAMFTGRFSPVVLEYVELAHELKMIVLDPWAAADAIIQNGKNPNYMFRLSLRDGLAMPVMLQRALGKGAERVGLLLPNTTWGKSNLAVAENYFREAPLPRSVGLEWYQWGEKSMVEKYQALRAAGAQAIVFVANDSEAVILCRELAALPPEQRLPVISHWGVTGGNFVKLVGQDLAKLDFSVVQTFSFYKADPEIVQRVLGVSARLFGLSRIEDIESPVGFGQAYDLTHLVARAIDLADTTDRGAVRDALERVTHYRGLVKFFERPFTADNHEALGAEDVFMATYRPDGAIIPLAPGD
ncbi:MAG: ABC transporter substrate-binding protein [Candidatus Competibacter sp.]|nr:ABC transporter substrate-binding protein [Candidatus Competibacteraceae bacterium]